MQPVLGRTFWEEELRPNGERVIVIGQTLWRDLFGGDPGVLGRTLTIEARPYIERAKALGGGHSHVISKHVLPAVLPAFPHARIVPALRDGRDVPISIRPQYSVDAKRMLVGFDFGR